MSTQVNYERTGELPRVTARAIRFPFNQYEVLVAVSESGEILGIQEIRLRKDFRAPSQIGSVDFSDDYRD